MSCKLMSLGSSSSSDSAPAAADCSTNRAGGFAPQLKNRIARFGFLPMALAKAETSVVTAPTYVLLTGATAAAGSTPSRLKAYIEAPTPPSTGKSATTRAIAAARPARVLMPLASERADLHGSSLRPSRG